MRDTTEIDKILEDLDDLHKRMVKWLEEQKDQQNQVAPLIDPIPFTPIVPHPVVSKCSECGLELNQTMGYVCSRFDCPTGLGPTCNSTGQEGHSALTTGKPLC